MAVRRFPTTIIALLRSASPTARATGDTGWATEYGAAGQGPIAAHWPVIHSWANSLARERWRFLLDDYYWRLLLEVEVAVDAEALHQGV